jgi:hypothetical protein
VRESESSIVTIIPERTDRDFVYIGRYKCSGENDSLYKSVSGVLPKTNITITEARTGCTGLGNGFYQFGFHALWTIRLLYLVEFADWNSSKTIGVGGSSYNSVQNTGLTDTMQYHTGTIQNSRSTNGMGIQYRYIEDLWANIMEWVDGVTCGLSSSSMAYSIVNTPQYYSYSDSASIPTGYGVSCYGTSSTGCIKAWTGDGYSNNHTYRYIVPNATVSDSTYSTYVSSLTTHNSALTMRMYCGRDYDNGRGANLFSNSLTGTASASWLGARLIYLPPNS